MGDCSDTTVLMSLALDGLLSPEEQEALMEHVMGCDACQAEWERWQAVESLLSSDPSLGPAAGFSARVLERIDARAYEHRRRLGGALLVGGWLSMWSLAILSLVAAGLLWGLTDSLWRIQVVKVLSQFVPALAMLVKAARVAVTSLGSEQAFPYVAALSGWVAGLSTLLALLLRRARLRLVTAVA